MTYEEFCNGVGMKIDPACYERIEAVYMAFDRFSNKQAIYDFYKAHDMNGVETLYTELRRQSQRAERRKLLEEQDAQIRDELSNIIGEMNKYAVLCGIRIA